MTPESLREQLQYPDWYIRLEEYLRSRIFPVVHDDLNIEKEREVFYRTVMDMLAEGSIPLAESGPDLDAERKSLDSIVIHHTETYADISLAGLSAIGFVRQYALNYLNDDVWGVTGLRGQPIWSGHFREGRMVFFAYHWLIRPDGTAERLLEDSEIGHHSMDMNARSIGIAFSGNYEHSSPPLPQIQGAAKVIREHYDFVEKERIFGHCEVMENRTCPGDKFLNEWKETLLHLSS